MIRLPTASACLVLGCLALAANASPPLYHTDALVEQEVFPPLLHSGSFGAAVAIDATDTLALVGAPLDPYGGGIEQGSVYAYVNSNGTWQMTQQLLASSDEDGGSFGYSIAISGTTAIIGAYTYGTLFFGGSPAIGKAYIFNYVNGVWNRAAELMAVDARPFEEFGFSVAIDGTTALIGAPEFGSAAGAAGAVYVFKKNAFGLWLQSQKLTSSNDQTIEGRFGWSVALSGDAAAIGQLRNAIGKSTIYFFSRAGGTWTQSQSITPGLGGLPASALAMADSIVVAGAPAYVVNGHANQGAAYVFRFVNGSWGVDQTLINVGGQAGDQFGHSVAIREPHLLIGAIEATVAGNVAQGAAFYYTEVNGHFGAGTRITASNGVASDWFGTSTAIADNGIGPTYLVGAHGVFKSGVATGAAYFYTGP